jgi:hypothetical protein
MGIRLAAVQPATDFHAKVDAEERQKVALPAEGE